MKATTPLVGDGTELGSCKHWWSKLNLVRRTSNNGQHVRIRPSLCGDYSLTHLLHKVHQQADGLSVPLCHGDFGYDNAIADDKYRVVNIIDWETAFAGPWGVFGDFSLTLSTVPPAMDEA